MFDSILDDVDELGAERIGPARFWRVDVAADCRFVDPEGGLAVLAAVANTPLSRTEVGTRGRPLETVNLFAPSGRRVIALVYDKGVESRRAQRGTLLRFEARQYWRGKQGPTMPNTGARELKLLFEARFGALADSRLRLNAETPTQELDGIAQLFESAEITKSQANAAFVAVCERATGLADRLPPATVTRRRAALRRVGLSEGFTGVFETRTLALGPFAQGLLNSELWGV